MSESAVQTESRNDPQVTYLKDYQVPAYLIDEIDLNFDLNEDSTLVTSYLRVRHNRFSTSNVKDLVLNGEGLTLESITLNGEPIPETQYQVTENFLTIHQVPDNLNLKLKPNLSPSNTALVSISSC